MSKKQKENKKEQPSAKSIVPLLTIWIELLLALSTLVNFIF
jgi:hypothetical protein